MRSLIHYLFAIVFLTIYGAQICPFLESLSAFTLAGIVFTGLSCGYLARFALIRILIDPLENFRQAGYQFFLELAVFIVCGLGMAIHNLLILEFPFASGLKLTVGCTVLGFFAAADLALSRERECAGKIAQSKQHHFSARKFFPLTRKFSYLGSVLTLLTASTLTLVILHDLDWIRQLPPEQPLTMATRSITIEIAFTLGVLLLYLINLIFSYARNIKHYFDRQTKVLEDVAKGKFEGHVPITTNDEFAVIGTYTNHMIEELRDRAEALAKTQAATIRALASLAETRDNETGQHIIRTQYYVRVLAEDLKTQEKFSKQLDEKTIDLLFQSAPLHDAGKVGVPDKILLKPGKLTAEEFEAMKKHATYGRDALRVAETELGSDSFLRLASEIAYTHHEKWDGSGYPEKLKGNAIPLSGRLMALADVYDALISKRVYKPAFTHEKAYSIILEGRGQHFDPDVVDAFVRREMDFKAIAREHADTS